MKYYTENELQSLKTSLCNGNKEVIRTLSQLFFPEIWANILLGELDEKADALISLEIEMQNDLATFCKSQMPVEAYLRSKWQSKLRAIRKRTISYDETYMQSKLSEPIEENNHNGKKEQYYPFKHLLASLDPIERMLFEVKYIQELNGKNGVFQVTYFLLNAASIGNPLIHDLLIKNNDLYEPLIREFLIQQAKNAFTTETNNKDESLLELLQKLPISRSQLKKVFHSYEMKVFRMLNTFRKKMKEIDFFDFFINQFSTGIIHR